MLPHVLPLFSDRYYYSELVLFCQQILRNNLLLFCFFQQTTDVLFLKPILLFTEVTVHFDVLFFLHQLLQILLANADERPLYPLTRAIAAVFGMGRIQNLRFESFEAAAADIFGGRALRDHLGHRRKLLHVLLQQIDIRMNRVMTILTVLSTIFMPLTLIAGWYGMNFRYMPELNWPWSYPIVFVVCIVIVVACLVFFKKKKWL